MCDHDIILIATKYRQMAAKRYAARFGHFWWPYGTTFPLVF